MKFRKTLLAVLIAASLGGISAPTHARTGGEIYLDSEPPPARHEAAPASRRGYIWVPGYWDHRGKKHVWRAGHWQRQRAGHHFIAPRWVQRDKRWFLERGHWKRGDRDRDGIPNSRDRDRDGDGVSNNRDRKPDNPRRQ